MKSSGQRLKSISLFIASTCLLVSCSISRFVPEGQYLLDDVAIKTDNKDIRTNQFKGYIRQHPNSKWFSLLKVPMSPYLLSGTDTTKWINRFLQRIGETPVIYDTVKASRTREDIETAMRNLGYHRSEVHLEEKIKRHKLKAIYNIRSGERFYVSELSRSVKDDSVRALIYSTSSASYLQAGMPFDVNILDKERSRINKLLRNNGYYLFNKEFVRFQADTTDVNNGVWLNMIVDDDFQNQQSSHTPHRKFHVGKVVFVTDSLLHRRSIRENVLKNKTLIDEGEIFQEQHIQDTYSNLASLGAVMNSNIKMQESEADSTSLDAIITVTTNKPHTFNAELEGTNSAGDLGAAISFSYQNRNLMRGSELLSLKIRGAYEAIRGLEGYDDQDYIEYGTELSLAFPDLMIPWLSRNTRRKLVATSEISMRYDSQDRPEFHRRVVTGTWRYRWNTDNHRRQHRVDLIDFNYVFMPWISSTFRRDYLDNSTSRNAILRYNYEDLFIMRWGYTLNYSSQPLTAATGSYGTNAWNLRLNVESSGNLLYGITSMLGTEKNGSNQYTLFNIAYAQYVKGDIDFAKSFSFTPDNSLAIHFGLGVAYPYGNSTILPFEKRYFSGGANSVRGWSVRELGPGSFIGKDGRVDFINQTGDIKLDMNIEYRGHLFWVLDGAAFIDAGNIWTFREYDEQPGGQFKLNKFWKQIAVSYGLGIRLNFNYFILRLDGGMKAIHPAYSDSKRHYPIIHPNFKRDFSLHFAVGLPF